MKTCPRCGETFPQEQIGSRGWCRSCDRAYHRAYYRDHRAYYRAYGAAYRASRREAERARAAAWHRAHPDRAAATSAARTFGERVSPDVWREVWSGTCFGCGKTPAEGVDHIVPRSKGGRNIAENLQPACLSCNRRKGRRLTIELGVRA